MHFLGGATGLNAFLKAYKTVEKKGFSPYEWFDNAKKPMHQSLSSYDDFCCQLRNCSPLDKTGSDYQNLLTAGCNTAEAFKKSNFLKFLEPVKKSMRIYSKFR